MKTNTATLGCLALASALILGSCDSNKSSSTATPAAPASPADRQLVDQVLAAAPQGSPAAIHTVRPTAKPGEEVTLKGRIMGNVSPFVEGRAAFVLGDPEVIAACNDKPGDECETPWDSCCNTPEERKKGTATIQIVDAGGKVVKQSLEGIGGVAKLATLTVSGKVSAQSTPEMLIVDASAIRVEK